jgi:hypothetical protein
VTPHIETPDGREFYLPETEFNVPLQAGYTVQVTSDGVTVYSECCADTMSVETARLLHVALGRYLADQPGEQS